MICKDASGITTSAEEDSGISSWQILKRQCRVPYALVLTGRDDTT